MTQFPVNKKIHLKQEELEEASELILDIKEAMDKLWGLTKHTMVGEKLSKVEGEFIKEVIEVFYDFSR